MNITSILTDNKISFILFFVLITFIIADLVINAVVDLIELQLISVWSIAFFTAMVLTNGFILFFFLRFIRRWSGEPRNKDPFLRTSDRVVTLVQYTLILLMVIVVAEILVLSQYQTIVLTTAVAISEITYVGIMAFFAYRFFAWFNINRNSFLVFLYGLSFALISFSFAVVATDDLSILLQRSPERTAESEVFFAPDVDYWNPFESSLSDLLFRTYIYFNFVGFILLFPATAMLLYHYVKKLGKLKFWIIISLPLVYFVSTNIEYFGVVHDPPESELFWWNIYSSLSSAGGGILFGVAFWTIGKSLRKDSAVRQYMIIAAYGFIISFMSVEAYLIAASYPPYGLVAISFLPLSAYMMFLGLYSTAISISQDNQLRKSIKNFATQNSNLLSSIGTAHMEQEIQRTVNSMKNVVAEQEKELEEQTGIEANLEEDEMKNYLEEVMQEVGKAKKPPT